MKRSNILVIVIVILIAVVAVWVFMFNKPSSISNNTNASNNSSSATATATITYTDSGFSPSMVTVKSGDTVAVKNNSSSTIQFDSDPHPVHTDDTDLNVGTVDPGQTKTFTVTKTGQFGYHNHFNPNQKGSITIN